MRKPIVLSIAAVASVAALLAFFHLRGNGTTATPEPVADPASQRPTAQGPVVGFRDGHGTLAWFGIPYAAPPVGALRWRAPRPPALRQQPLLATRLSAPCAQLENPSSGAVAPASQGISGAEDCLYLNLWAPADAQKLPVMVWIHGGGNTIGSANSYLSMAALAGPQRVLVVALNYRLGVLGWFAHPALQGDSAPNDRYNDDSGNFGTLDLIAGLQWVHDNIAAFGGDPRQVTVFGESAGGMNVFSLLAAPAARGLFQRAISESGMPLSYPLAEATDGGAAKPGAPPFGSRPLVDRLLVADRLAPDLAAARRLQADWPAEKLRSYLRGKTPAELLAPLRRGGSGFAAMYRWPAVVRDGRVMPDGPLMDAIAQDPQRPVIVGTNHDETRLFQASDPAYVDLWFGKIPRIKDKAAYIRDTRYSSDAWRLAGADEPARRLQAAGAPVFAYRFDWDALPVNPLVDLKTLFGASHGFEVGFLLGDKADVVAMVHGATADNAAGRAELGEAMRSYWGVFAHSGDPGQGRDGRLPAWRRWDPAGAKTIVFDTREKGGIRMVDEQLTVAALQQRLLADPSLPDAAARCRRYAATLGGMFGAALGWNQAAYDGFGPEGCAGVKATDHSWR